MTECRQSDIDHYNWLKILGINSFTNLNILDLGCGSGYLCQKAMSMGASQALGVDVVKPETDPSEMLWEFGQLNLNEPQWHEELTSKFDLLFAFDILEHLDSPSNFLVSCRKSLSSNGLLVVTTPNVNSWECTVNPNNWSGVQDPQHKTLFTKYSLAFLLKKSGFSDINLQAPIRKLSFLGALQPQIGGQILCTAKP